MNQLRELGHQLLRFSFAENHRRQQTHHLVGGYIDQQAGIEGKLNQFSARAIKLDSNHQAIAADLGDGAQSRQFRAKPAADGLSQPEGILHQAILLDDGKRRQRRNAGKRIAAKSRAMTAQLEHASRLGGGQAGADGQSRTETLGQCHDIRHHTGMLVREPAAGAASTALHLVHHQQPALGIAYLAQSLDVFIMSQADSAFALDRFEKNRDDI